MTELFFKILNMSISASWLVLAVIALRFLLKRTPKWIHVFLWAIVAVRLICPFSVESALSLLPSAETITPEIMLDTTPEITSGVSAVDQVINPVISGSNTPATPGTSVNPLQIYFAVIANIWVLGIVILFVYTAFTYLKLRKTVADAIPLGNRIYQSEHAASPFVLGIISPKIYLPFQLNENDMESIIKHEKAHIARRDYWWKPIGFLLLSIHWFNPLMWAAYILLCRDIEMACDEKVIQQLSEEQRADYSQALLNSSINRYKIAACPLAFGETGVKERVKSVLNYKKPAFWAILTGIITCIVLAVCFLTDPVEKEPLPVIEYPLTMETVERLKADFGFPEEWYVVDNEQIQTEGTLASSYSFKSPDNSEVHAGHKLGILSRLTDNERGIGVNLSSLDNKEEISMEECEQAIIFTTRLFGGFSSENVFSDEFLKIFNPREEDIILFEKEIEGYFCQVKYHPKAPVGKLVINISDTCEMVHSGQMNEGEILQENPDEYKFSKDFRKIYIDSSYSTGYQIIHDSYGINLTIPLADYFKENYFSNDIIEVENNQIITREIIKKDGQYEVVFDFLVYEENEDEYTLISPFVYSAEDNNYEETIELEVSYLMGDTGKVRNHPCKNFEVTDTGIRVIYDLLYGPEEIEAVQAGESMQMNICFPRLYKQTWKKYSSQEENSDNITYVEVSVGYDNFYAPVSYRNDGKQLMFGKMDSLSVLSGNILNDAPEENHLGQPKAAGANGTIDSIISNGTWEFFPDNVTYRSYTTDTQPKNSEWSNYFKNLLDENDYDGPIIFKESAEFSWNGVKTALVTASNVIGEELDSDAALEGRQPENKYPYIYTFTILFIEGKSPIELYADGYSIGNDDSGTTYIPVDGEEYLPTFSAYQYDSEGNTREFSIYANMTGEANIRNFRFGPPKWLVADIDGDGTSELVFHVSGGSSLYSYCKVYEMQQGSVRERMYLSLN